MRQVNVVSSIPILLLGLVALRHDRSFRPLTHLAGISVHLTRVGRMKPSGTSCNVGAYRKSSFFRASKSRLERTDRLGHIHTLLLETHATMKTSCAHPGLHSIAPEYSKTCMDVKLSGARHCAITAPQCGGGHAKVTRLAVRISRVVWSQPNNLFVSRT